MAQDFYETLGVAENATQDDIKKQFRKLAKKYHPDRNKGDKAAESKFKELSEAYDTLGDSAKRKEYDQMRKYGAFAGNFGGYPPGGGSRNTNFDPRTGGAHVHVEGFENIEDMEDILSQFFGGRGSSTFGDTLGRQRKGRKQKAPDSLADITVSFIEAALGSKKVISLPEGKKLSVTIPAGLEDGAKIRLAGQGAPSVHGGSHGDLILTVHVAPDPAFSRNGNDLLTTIEATFKEAMLGAKKNVRTLTQVVAITIPAGTQPGAQLRLKGQGITAGGVTGDLYVTVQVTLPRTLTEKQKSLLEEWDD